MADDTNEENTQEEGWSTGEKLAAIGVGVAAATALVATSEIWLPLLGVGAGVGAAAEVAGGLGVGAEVVGGLGTLSRVVSGAKKVGSLAKKAGALDIAYRAGEMMGGGGEGGGGAATESSGGGGGLGETAKRARGAAGYNPLEMSILRSEGITSQGWWLGREGKSVKRDEVESTLKDSPFTVIIKKLDILNSIVSKLLTEITQVKNISREQLELNQKIYDSMAIAKAEEGADGNISPVKRKSATVERIKGTAKDALMDFLKTFAAGLTAMLFRKSKDTRPKQYAGQTLAKNGTLSELQMSQAEWQTARGEQLTPEVAKAYEKTQNNKIDSVISGTNVEGLPVEYRNNPVVQKIFLERHTKEFQKKFIETLVERAKLHTSRSSDVIRDDAEYAKIQAEKTEDIAGIGGFINNLLGIKKEPLSPDVEQVKDEKEPLSPDVEQVKDEDESSIERKDRLVKEFSKKMGIDIGEKYEAKFQGGIPVSINGTQVPENLYNAEQLKSLSTAKKLGGMVTDKPTVTGKGRPGNASSDEAIKFFVDKGWSKEQAAGIVANLMIESNLSANALGDKGEAYGIAQWHPDRQADFKKQYGKDIRESTVQEQLEFVNWELNNTEKKAGNAIRKTEDALTAAATVDQSYERSKGKHRQLRINTAASLAEKNPTAASLAEKNPTAPASATPATPTAPAPAAPPAATPATPAPTAPTVIAMNTPAKQPAAPSTQFETPAPAHPYSQEDEYAVYFNIFDKMGIPSFA